MAFQPVGFKQRWPGTPTLNSATTTSSSTVDLNLSCAFPFQAGTIHEIYYRPNNIGAWSFYGATSGAGTSITVTVAGLAASTLYGFRIRSSYFYITVSEYSATLTATTLSASVDTTFVDDDPQVDGSAPWVVYFYDKFDAPMYLTGVLIAADVVLTSAVVADAVSAASGYASAGFADLTSQPHRQDVTIATFLNSPGYSWPTDDLALIFLGSGGFTLNAYIQEAPYVGGTEPFGVGTLVASLDWVFRDSTPTTLDNVLHSSVLEVISEATANTAGPPASITVTNKQLAGINSGSGDWGTYGAGVMAWDGTNNYCIGICNVPADAINDQMSVATRVSYYKSWIQTETGITPYT